MRPVNRSVIAYQESRMFVLLCRLGRLFTAKMTNKFIRTVKGQARRLAVFHCRIQDLPLAIIAELKLEWLVLRKTPEAAVESLNHS